MRLTMFPRALSAWLLPRPRQLSDGVVLEPRLIGSLFESLSVIAIIAVLVVSALDDYRPAVFKAAMSEAAGLSRAYETELVVDLAVRGRLPDRIEAIEDHGRDGGHYFGEFIWQDDELVGFLKPELAARLTTGGARAADGPPPALSFRIAQTPATGRTIFLCGNAAPPPGFEAAPAVHTSVPRDYLPFFCRT